MYSARQHLTFRHVKARPLDGHHEELRSKYDLQPPRPMVRLVSSLKHEVSRRRCFSTRAPLTTVKGSVRNHGLNTHTNLKYGKKIQNNPQNIEGFLNNTGVNTVRDQLRLCFLVWKRFHRQGSLGIRNIMFLLSSYKNGWKTIINRQFLRHKRYEVHVVKINIQVFWDISLCKLINCCLRNVDYY